MFRAIVLTVALVASLIPAATAQAADFDPSDMAFPVGGDQYLITDSFGDCRESDCSRSHEGVDIMAPKGTPVYAAGDGVAHWVSVTQEECCRLQIDHGNGWATRYIHLNDDTQNEDGTYNTDDLGWGIAEGIVDGTPVTKGQLIGWVGDSGNATEGVPHLHFELRTYDGDIWNSTAIDSYEYLLLAEDGQGGQFRDDDDSKHEADIEKIYAAGITKGCNPPTNDLYCGEEWVTRGQMSAFIRRWFEFPSVETDYYSDDDGTTFEDDINALTEVGIAFGCEPDAFCSDEPLLREEFAEMFVRAFGYTNPDQIDWHVDDDDSAYEESINALRAADVTLGCNPPENDRFCPYRGVEREEMASFFVRALDL